MSKLPDDLKWSEEVLALLAETDKTSCKSVCIALGKAAEAKDTKAAAMAGVKELCDWAKEQKVYWTESFVVTLFPTIMAVRAAAAASATLLHPPSAAPSRPSSARPSKTRFSPVRPSLPPRSSSPTRPARCRSRPRPPAPR